MEDNTANCDAHNSQTINQYSVQAESSKILQRGILENNLMSDDIPLDVHEAASHIHFIGSPSPSIPVNWRYAEAISSLKGLEGAIVNALIKRKYNSPMREATIDTDHASLFIMSAGLWTIDPGEGGLNISSDMHAKNTELEKYFPDTNIYKAHSSLYRSLCTNVYRCADSRYYALHSSLNPNPSLDVIGIPHDVDVTSYEEAVEYYQGAIGKISSEDMDRRITDARQAGSICHSAKDFLASEHGQANKNAGLWELHAQPSESQPACWWPAISSTSERRPLAGLKVVDICRIIAAPAVTRGLAELGASVMRITSPDLPDVSALHPDLQWGKWNCNINLKDAAGREKLRALILEADIVVQGYRPGVLDKHGFSQQDILDMCARRSRGIISVREDCYGWHGPDQNRPGWEQVSDCNTGVSEGWGRAMGLDGGEPVIPPFPAADYGTGESGVCASLLALLHRGEKGGSYRVDVALNYFNTWLVNSVGEYPSDVWDRTWAENGRKIWRHYHPDSVTGAATIKSLRDGEGGKRLFKPEFFEDRAAPGALGKMKMRQVKPVVQWKSGTVEPGFRVGARGNGVDAARWPEDLSVETVTESN